MEREREREERGRGGGGEERLHSEMFGAGKHHMPWKARHI